MKSVIRFFALFVVVAGTAALALAPKSTRMVVPSHLAATDGFPVPSCGPYMPGCKVAR
jgi:hypothetical protein